MVQQSFESLGELKAELQTFFNSPPAFLPAVPSLSLLITQLNYETLFLAVPCFQTNHSCKFLSFSFIHSKTANFSQTINQAIFGKQNTLSKYDKHLRTSRICEIRKKIILYNIHPRKTKPTPRSYHRKSISEESLKIAEAVEILCGKSWKILREEENMQKDCVLCSTSIHEHRRLSSSPDYFWNFWRLLSLSDSL